MCVDHAGLALFPSVGAFRCIGRPAFPLYCFLLVQGFRHTRDLRAYARRLLLLACVSEVPFDLLIFGQFSSAMEQNGVFALLLGLMALYGTALTVVQTAITTMLQEHTEADMQGRVFGLLSTMYAGCLPLGMAIFGPLADVVSLRWIMAGAGGAILAAAAAVGTDHRMRAV